MTQEEFWRRVRTSVSVHNDYYDVSVILDEAMEVMTGPQIQQVYDRLQKSYPSLMVRKEVGGKAK